jgi:hypothetical protein
VWVSETPVQTHLLDARFRFSAGSWGAFSIWRRGPSMCSLTITESLGIFACNSCEWKGPRWYCMRFEAFFQHIGTEDFHVRPIHVTPAPISTSGGEQPAGLERRGSHLGVRWSSSIMYVYDCTCHESIGQLHGANHSRFSDGML